MWPPYYLLTRSMDRQWPQRASERDEVTREATPSSRPSFILPAQMIEMRFCDEESRVVCSPICLFCCSARLLSRRHRPRTRRDHYTTPLPTAALPTALPSTECRASIVVVRVRPTVALRIVSETSADPTPHHSHSVTSLL